MPPPLYTEEEELPPYSLFSISSEASAPHIYSLRQSSSKIQTLLPFAAAPPAVYNIKKIRGAAIISSRPDFIVSRKAPEEDLDQHVGNIRFSRKGDFPWVPRAHVRYGNDESSYCQQMVMKRMVCLEWRVGINSVPCYWRLMAKPTNYLALFEVNTGEMLAKFIYSDKGTYARSGEEVGRFEIFLLDDSWKSEILEQIICSAYVVIAFGKSVGKFLTNRAAPSYC